VRVVISDAGPLHYLVLIELIDLLPRLFDMVSVPETVRRELQHPYTPLSVRTWMDSRPTWLRVMPAPPAQSLPLPALDDGARSVIALGLALRADLILMDDRSGVAAALAEAFEVTGTLGILDRAARRGLIDLAPALARLTATNFRFRQAAIDELLARHQTGKGRA
jgi:predicted nucleic acid-binding protein